MERRHFGWFGGLIVIGLLVAVAFFAYNVGITHGLAQSGALAGAAQGAVPTAVWGPRPWGFGIGFLFPLFFLFLGLAILRRLAWGGCGGRWHRRGWYGDDVPPAFEEWHRRMHAQPGGPAGTDTKS